MDLICDSINNDVLRWANSLTPISILSSNANDERNKQEASFMYSRLLNEIFIDMETMEEEVNAFILTPVLNYYL